MNFGMTMEWSNGHYTFGGGTQPWGLAFAGTIIGLYVLLMYCPPADRGDPLPGVFRRFAAFWLDFVLAIVAVTPIVGILLTVTEWRRTGVFQWNFERTTQASSDGLIAAIGTIFSAAGLILYYSLPLVRRKPSPGACIVGYQVIPEDGTTLSWKTAFLRTLLGFLAACTAWLAPFVGRDRKKGQFWLDKVFHTRAVKLG
jgi:uncharacterized RDD family membrane protein YckC